MGGERIAFAIGGYILSLSGTQFDPDVVEAFKDESENFRAIAARLAD